MSLYSGKATDHVVFDRLFQAKETCAVSYKNNPGNTGMAKQEEEWRASRKSACEAVQRKSGDDCKRARLAPMCFTRPFSGSASFCGGSLNPGLLERRSIFLASPIPWNVRKSHQHQHRHVLALAVDRIMRNSYVHSTLICKVPLPITSISYIYIHKYKVP
jgi:hypothetical protein